MRLKLIDIPEEGGRSVSANATEDPWFSDLLQASLGEDYRKGQTAWMEAHLLKTCGNVQVSGNLEIDLNPTCDRCLEPFERHLSIPVAVSLSPAEEARSAAEGDDEIELTEEDLNFSFYEGDEIDLGDLLRQFLLLEIPIHDLCRNDCKGLCPHCGKNLNLNSCTCRPVIGDPRFAVLKKLKLPQ